MASYDLKCRSCGNDFEVFVLGFLKDDAKVCPDCGGREVEQRFTGFGGRVGPGLLRRRHVSTAVGANLRVARPDPASAERPSGTRAVPNAAGPERGSRVVWGRRSACVR